MGVQLNPDALIKITDLRLRTYIGIKEEEIRNKQDILLNAEITYDASSAIRENRIEEALNYRTICKEVIDYVENNRFALLERLTQDVLLLVMEHPRVKAASVQIDKPHALRFSESVSITLSAIKDEQVDS
jgi:D-erythro-7,8-dihydroneopterin triphosphate epimerase